MKIENGRAEAIVRAYDRLPSANMMKENQIDQVPVTIFYFDTEKKKIAMESIVFHCTPRIIRGDKTGHFVWSY